MLLQEEQYILKWLSQYGALTRTQLIKMLQKPKEIAGRILDGLEKQHRIAEISGGYYLGLDEYVTPDTRMIQAIWVLLKFIENVDPMAHYPAVYPAQLFFLKENTGYEIVVLHENEGSLLKLLQPEEELKYIIVIPHISMVKKFRLPKAPYIFATVDYRGEAEPEVKFYSKEGD